MPTALSGRYGGSWGALYSYAPLPNTLAGLALPTEARLDPQLSAAPFLRHELHHDRREIDVVDRPILFSAGPSDHPEWERAVLKILVPR